MRLRAFLILALCTLFLAGCGEQKALSAAQAQGTPEGYEAFLEQYPNSVHADILRVQIEDLRYQAAKEGEGPEGWREYIKHHPDGKHKKAAKRHEDEASFMQADRERTTEAYQRYLDSHPDGKFVKKARAEMEELAYVAQISIENYRVEKVNLANDPKGDLNGWGLYADVTNNGKRIIIELEVRMDFLNDAGEAIGDRTWWVVAEQLIGMPTPPRIVPPLRAESSREFQFTTGEPPEGWNETFKLTVTNVRFRQ